MHGGYMTEEIIKIYEELEEIKRVATNLGFQIGEIKFDEDLPYVKINVSFMKRIENGTDKNFN